MINDLRDWIERAQKIGELKRVEGECGCAEPGKKCLEGVQNVRPN
jgi:hypothetical protein